MKPRYTRGVLAKYANHVTSASLGFVTTRVLLPARTARASGVANAGEPLMYIDSNGRSA